ncbi:MAG: hypothetical protein IJ714_01950 [Bacteroidales bacterium]|nr:hypothetical protein [Bacteroidales bacterium]
MKKFFYLIVLAFQCVLLPSCSKSSFSTSEYYDIYFFGRRDAEGLVFEYARNKNDQLWYVVNLPYSYKYRLVISGELSEDSFPSRVEGYILNYVVLSNTLNVTLERCFLQPFQSGINDITFNPSETIIVQWW